MTWSISFAIEDGKFDPESVSISGTPRDGRVNLNGWTNGGYQSLNVNAYGMSAGASVYQEVSTPLREGE